MGMKMGTGTRMGKKIGIEMKTVGIGVKDGDGKEDGENGKEDGGDGKEDGGDRDQEGGDGAGAENGDGDTSAIPLPTTAQAPREAPRPLPAVPTLSQSHTSALQPGLAGSFSQGSCHHRVQHSLRLWEPPSGPSCARTCLDAGTVTAA